MEVRIVFRRTSSRDFPRALQLAERQAGFSEEASGYEVRFDQDHLEECCSLCALVGRWAQTRFFLNGHPVERQGLEHLLACYRARLAAADRRAYCAGSAVHHTPVGPARQLFPCRLIPISEGNHDGWFGYGRLTRDGVFVVDKGQLRQAVAESLDETLAVHCPALFPAEVDAVVDRLPDRIDPGRDSRWTWRKGWQNGRFVPVGVCKREAAGAEAANDVATGGRDGGGRWAPPRTPAAESTQPRGQAAGGAPAAAPPSIPPVRYADIGGLQAQIRVVRENLELPLRFPDLFARLGVQPHRGILLCGPPGTGKTMLARALATECAAAFVAIDGPEILSKWRGESEANLRRVFDEAREQEPAIVLIDEIDSIAPDRSRTQHNHEAVLVSQLLTLLDGLGERGRVAVVATTNRPDLVDPAVRRPGRLDLMLDIGMPDMAARQEILRIHTGRMPLAPDVDVQALAEATPGFAGAHLGSLCREAALECMREVVGLDGSGAFTLDPAAVEELAVRPEHFQRALVVVGRGVERADGGHGGGDDGPA